MKRFFQILTLPFVWGWKILSSGLSVLVNLLFLASLVAVLSLLLYRPPVTVPDGAALVLAPEGSIVEKRSPIDPLTRVINRLAGGPLSEDVALQDLLDTIDHAADDSNALKHACASVLDINIVAEGPRITVRASAGNNQLVHTNYRNIKVSKLFLK